MATLVAIAVVVSPGVAWAGLTDEVNQDRAAVGLPPLAEDPGLNSIAQARSVQMAASGSLAHTLGMLSLIDAVLAVPVTGAGENVGVGPNPTAVNDMFIGSPAHRSNILGDYNVVGIGAALGGDGRFWVTQVFARVGAAAPVAQPATVARPTTVRRCRTRRACRRRSVRRSRTRCSSVRRSRCRSVRRSRSARRSSAARPHYRRP